MSNRHSSANQSIPELERLPAIMVRTGLKRSSLYALVAAGHFPKPIKLSKRSSAWIVKEVEGWIADRIAERDAGPRAPSGTQKRTDRPVIRIASASSSKKASLKLKTEKVYSIR